MAYFEWTHLSPPDESLGGFSFNERTAINPTPKPPSEAVTKSWVVDYRGQPIMVGAAELPVEVSRVRGLPIYWDQVHGIWFVDGYPEDFTRFGNAVAYAESLVPAEVPPPTQEPPTSVLSPLAGLVWIAFLLG